MKKLIVLFIFSVSFNSFYGQNMEIIWQHCFGGTNDEEAYSIIKSNECYYIAGVTFSSDGDISYNHGGSDAWLITIDSSGSILWQKSYGGSNGEIWEKIIPVSGNNFYLIGASGSSDGDISYDPYPGSIDIWIAKIDSIGNLIWEKIIGGSRIDMIQDATITNDGGIVVLGWTGSPDGDVTEYFGMYDMWLVKLNSEGDIEWDRSFGTDDFDWGYSIIQTSDGGFLVGGSSYVGNGGNLTCDPFNYESEAVIFKLDSIGNIEWQNCYGGSGDESVYAIIELDDGYVFCGDGWSEDGDLTDSGWHGNSDFWVVKLGFYGNIVWQKCYGGSRGEYPLQILKEADNSLIIYGITKSNDGDVSGNHSSSEYDNDIWIIKLSSEGELLSQQCIGGTRNELIDFGVVKKNDYDYVIAAQTNYGPSYDVQCTPHGDYPDTDYWLFELKDCTYYAPATPDTPCGADTACSAGGAATVYTVAPAQNAWSYAWQLLPETAGTVTGDSTAATVSWAENYEGTAVITVRSQNDCGQSAWSEPKYTQVQTCLGTEETPEETTVLRVYPNPAKDYVVFEFDVQSLVFEVKGQTEIKIYDAFGREVSCLPVAQKKTIWFTKNVRSGLYYYKTEINCVMLSGKVVVR
ncbi:MAG: hypothetical protein DRI87_03520 [Bacteroidetes bacterium]|nr:MAG: hypothetical protein DRI87_03520 [Bacteroidota bacterium]